MRNYKNEAIEYMARGLAVPDFIVKGLIDENQSLKGKLDHYQNKERVYACNGIKAGNNDISPLYPTSMDKNSEQKHLNFTLHLWT